MLGTKSLAKYANHADGIKDATIAVLEEFCAPGTGAPYCSRVLRERHDAHLQQHMQRITELLDTDAAKDEVLAMQKLQGKRSADGGETKTFPNVKIQSRDKPHASRRITSRTWPSDPYLCSVSNSMVNDKSSITKVIANSFHFRSVFEKNCAKISDNPTSTAAIRDLSSKKHRWESSSKPYGRGAKSMKDTRHRR